MNLPWHLYAMSLIYIFAGIMHFIRPKMYMKIMPPYIPFHKPLVYISGVAEIAFGLMLLFDETRKWGIYGIIILLILFYPVHIYMFQKREKYKIPQWVIILRLPLQFVFIYWAWIYL